MAAVVKRFNKTTTNRWNILTIINLENLLGGSFDFLLLRLPTPSGCKAAVEERPPIRRLRMFHKSQCNISQCVLSRYRNKVKTNKKRKWRLKLYTWATIMEDSPDMELIVAGHALNIGIACLQGKFIFNITRRTCLIHNGHFVVMQSRASPRRTYLVSPRGAHVPWIRDKDIGGGRQVVIDWIIRTESTSLK